MNPQKSQDEGRNTELRPSIAFEDGPSGPLDIKLVDLPGLISLWVLAVIVFLQFFTRYVLNDSLAWTEEIARYVLILAAFLGAITVTRKGSHIFLEFFYRYLPAKVGKALSVAMEIISCLFFGYMAIVAVELALRTKTKMASAEIPKSLLYWAVGVGLAVMAVYSLIWIIRKIRQTPDEVLADIEEHAISENSD